MSSVIHADHQWLEQVQEDIIDPDRPIIDPHHHLWHRRRGGGDYLLKEFWQDTGSGHNIKKSVFIECHANYKNDGPEHLKPIGETEFVAAIARDARTCPEKTQIGAIIAHADLRLDGELDRLLDLHAEAADGLFRGIRQAGAWEDDGDFLFIQGRGPRGLYLDDKFRRGVKRLGARGLSYDTWHYHHQNQDFLNLAMATPDTQLVLDHFGTPLGVGPYADQRDAIFQKWKKDIAAIAKCENVVAKLGGLAMPDNGFGWNLGEVPPTSDEFVATQREYYLHTLDCFGPERCMFESNFPVDKWSLSYHVVWNGFKKMVADFSEAEKHSLFYGTAARIYGLD